jgi:hypothetical protein
MFPIAFILRGEHTQLFERTEGQKEVSTLRGGWNFAPSGASIKS